MTVSRLPLLAILVVCCASCSSSDGPAPFPPSAAWPKFRQNVNNTGGAIAPIAQTTPELRWTPVPVDEATPPHPVSSSPAVAVNGTIYVGSEGGTLMAVNGKGEVHWRKTTCDVCPTPTGPLLGRPTPIPLNFVSSPLVVTHQNVNTIYIASMDGRVLGFQDNGSSADCTMCFMPTALDPTITASPTWTTHPITGLVTGIFIGATVGPKEDRTGKVYGLNSDGSMQWEFPDPDLTPLRIGPVSASPALSFSNNALYVVTDDGAAYALTLGGSLLWMWSAALGDPGSLGARGTSAASDLAPSPVTTADLLLVASRDGRILALTLTGNLAWSWSGEEAFAASLAVGNQAVNTPTPTPTGLPTAIPTPSGAATATPSPTPTPPHAYSTAFGLTESGTLVVLDLRRGIRLEPRRSLPTPIKIHSSPALSLDQYLIFGTDEGWLYIIDTATGLPLPGWPVMLGAAIRSSPSVSDEGTIYVGAADGNLYAVGKR